MASKPFNTSAKEPMSVKLRGLNASKSVTRQLEIDSRRMEERLRELKVAMNREKQERERQGSAGSGGIWSSANTTAPVNDVIKKKSPTKPSKPGENKVRKIKVLKDTPIELPKRAPKKTQPGLNSVRKSFSGPPCGQCEEKAVALTCMECGENYCAGCFAKFHLKGALRQHRSIPFQSGSNENSPHSSLEASSNSQPGSIKQTVPKTSSGADSHSKQPGRVIIAKTTPPKNPSPKPANSAFDGEYNEEESAASFAAALAEWRQVKKGGQQNGIAGQTAKKDVHDMGSGTAAAIDDDKIPVEINFQDNSSVSYADRLLLKKHRRTDLPPALSPSPSQLANHYLPRETHSRISDSDLTNGHYDPSEEELEMEEEHQRYANIFVKESPREEMVRPSSSLTIMEITDEGPFVEKDLEVQSVYSVQEWDSVINAPSPHVQVMTPDNNNSEIKLTDSSMKGDKPNVMPSGKGSSKIDERVSGSSAKSAVRKDHEKQIPSRNTVRSASKAGPGTEKQMAKRRPGSKTSSASSSQRESTIQKNRPESMVNGRQSSKGRQSSAGVGKQKGQEDSQGRRSATERPPSAGITTLPSKELQEIGRMRSGLQHQQGYQDGLGSFFMGGVEFKDKERPGGSQVEPVRMNTPTNVLPECSYKGPSTWRPDSSMSNHPDQPATVLSPSPPKQARDNKSSSMSGRKRSSLPSATGAASPTKANASSAPTGTTPRAMSSKPRSGIQERTPRTSTGLVQRKGDASDVDNTLHWKLSQADKAKGSKVVPRKTATGDHSASSSASSMPPRSSSRIEVDGDDMTGYDDDGYVRRREEEDHNALEQLTWELASNEGRITADGRISSLSLIEGLDENLLLMAEEDQDRALGITQDDGLGSGLSTPCNDLSLDQLSEEELQSDFVVAADNQRYKKEVQALNS
ncbi:uncharacterized protein LOC129279281 [Lytechinus pictus]|uniref:uncharacterized protein LOC129279281 n=1 Tax=Lytechinus pictus TaxID=7653 RepID=UPI0030B9C7AE